MAQIVINTRVLNAPLTGVQRYTKALIDRWNNRVDLISPSMPLYGVTGHAWEQVVLPGKLSSRLLFSPSNTGPLRTGRQVLTIHDMSTFDCPENFNSRFIAWYQWLLPRLIQRVRLIITVSEFIKSRILAHVPVNPEKIVVITSGVDTRFCPDAILKSDELEACLRLPSRNYILTVSSVEPRKNLSRLFEAWGQVQRRLPSDLWLVVAGAAGKSHVFDQVRFKSLPSRIFFAGHVPEPLLPCLYASALATVYVSLYEGFGLPVVESMACGCPVLASDRASIPELVGDAGILVDPLSIDEIADGIVRLAENSDFRADLRQRGLLRCRRFSWDETATKTWRILNGVATADTNGDTRQQEQTVVS
jgi:glycosyltransferase involved in cell wall biosynthesis